ncbi:O-antigen polymerase [Lacticigenium naphthae]|uniref:O-antigen polymerase n=1 Tax=Lacticigenium naphthae TaxID=515351 RepID=UPI00042A1F85|nr:O-antigen polymerase [Lacticigenium naphthae]
MSKPNKLIGFFNKYNKHINSQLLLFLFISLTFNYILIIGPVYKYAGFEISNFSFPSFCIGLIASSIAIIFGSSITDIFYYSLYHIILIMNYLPAVILTVGMGMNINSLLVVILPLTSILFLEKFIPKVELSRPKLKYRVGSLISLTSILILPYLSRYQIINYSNLLFENVYESRANFKASGNPYFGYTSPLLMRYILPFILINSITRKKITLIIYILFMILLVFLTTGSLKGYIIYIVLMVFLSFGKNKYQKIGRFIKMILGISLFENLTFLITNEMFLGDYIRRALFVDPLLSRKYTEYFLNNYTFFSHTRIASIFGIDSLYRETDTITKWFGRYVIGTGTNASIGSFVEGFFSFGLIGLFIITLIFTMFIFIIRSCNIKKEYLGIIVIGCYVFIMTNIETAFVTQGLIFFVFLSLFIFPKSDRKINP